MGTPNNYRTRFNLRLRFDAFTGAPELILQNPDGGTINLSYFLSQSSQAALMKTVAELDSRPPSRDEYRDEYPAL